ncbi:MAG: hemerythrin family protein, partial [Helicobacter sp.]|nr:hemerythrin family protein [Helicobacter sp.]
MADMAEFYQNYSMKNPHLDSQHLKLIEYIAYTKTVACKTGDKSLELKEIASNLLKWAKEHIEDEEKYMARINYPFLKDHHALHLEFLKALKDIITKIDSSIDVSEELYVFLWKWFFDHILEEDRRIGCYRRYLREVNEAPYNFEQKLRVVEQRYDVSSDKKVPYVCLCPSRIYEVYESLDKEMSSKHSYIRCSFCKRPIVKLESDLEENQVK